jgi:hypothetical protein
VKKEEDAAKCAEVLSPFLLREISTIEVNVVKTPSDLIPKGGGNKSMVGKARCGRNCYPKRLCS